MLLDDVRQAVKDTIAREDELGVQITRQNDVPDTGPTNKGLWIRVDDVTAVFVDMKRSTSLSIQAQERSAARVYTYFIKSMAQIADKFGARYVDVQGDALFALFSGPQAPFHGLACAVTMRTLNAKLVAVELKREKELGTWSLACGVGIDRKALLVRRLGLRGAKENEVWAGKPVSMSAHLSSLANDDEVLVSDRFYAELGKGSAVRRRAALWSCGCAGTSVGPGFEANEGETPALWNAENAPAGESFDFATMYRLTAPWCDRHGSEFCEAIFTGKEPA